MKRRFFKSIVLGALFLAFGATVSTAGESILLRDAEKSGIALYNRNCSECHGLAGTGTGKGPTFLHKFYHPNHHSDWSFRSAVTNGVKAHHWRFGNMPKVKGLNPEEVDKIIGYIRALQREAGIF